MPFAFFFLCPFQEYAVPKRTMNWNRQIGVSVTIFRNEISPDESSDVQRLTDHLPNLSRPACFARSQPYWSLCPSYETQEPKASRQKANSNSRYSQDCSFSH